MDRNLSLVGSARRSFARGLALLPSRTTSVSADAPSAHPRLELKILKVARPVLWLVISVLLGIWAQSATSSSALLAWQREHHPSGLLWAAVIRARGFEEVTDTKTVQKLYRSLPATLGEGGEAWWSETDRSALVAWLDDAQSTQPFHVFCHAPCVAEAHGWQKIGSGWLGLESLLPRIQSFEERFRKAQAPVRGKKSEYRDPRELRF